MTQSSACVDQLQSATWWPGTLSRLATMHYKEHFQLNCRAGRGFVLCPVFICCVCAALSSGEPGFERARAAEASIPNREGWGPRTYSSSTWWVSDKATGFAIPLQRPREATPGRYIPPLNSNPNNPTLPRHSDWSEFQQHPNRFLRAPKKSAAFRCSPLMTIAHGIRVSAARPAQSALHKRSHEGGFARTLTVPASRLTHLSSMSRYSTRQLPEGPHRMCRQQIMPVKLKGPSRSGQFLRTMTRSSATTEAVALRTPPRNFVPATGLGAVGNDHRRSMLWHFANRFGNAWPGLAFCEIYSSNAKLRYIFTGDWLTRRGSGTCSTRFGRFRPDCLSQTCAAGGTRIGRI